jgi:hypothetical protein
MVWSYRGNSYCCGRHQRGGGAETGAVADENRAERRDATNDPQPALRSRSRSVGEPKSLDQVGLPVELTRSTETEIDDLVAFMASLTSSQYREMGEKELARQREITRTQRPQRAPSVRNRRDPPRPARSP